MYCLRRVSTGRDEVIFETVLSRLQLRLHEDRLMDLKTWMIGSTTVRAAHASEGGSKQRGLLGNLIRPLKHCRDIVADKGYDSDELRRY